MDRRRVLVTGASRGIGRAVAMGFAARDARVCIGYTSNEDAARSTLQSLDGSGHMMHRADVGDPRDAAELVEAVIRELGAIEVLVNNAGVAIEHPPATVASYEDWQDAWQRTLAVNLIGPANLTFLVARHMIERGIRGHVVNVSSRGAFRGEPDYPAYGASKAGLNALGQSMASALGPHGISVAMVAPGFVDETDMAQPILDGPEGPAIRAQSPWGRVATSEEVAAAVLFLASGDCDFATGGIIDVNGASYLRT